MMLLTMIIAGLAFTVMVAMLGLGYQRIEQERSERSAAALEQAPSVQPGRCMLCNAPLRQQSTVAEVLYEVEHRIDAELQDVSALLRMRPPPEGYIRLYQA